MSKVLVTFGSTNYGDILWSLPTVKVISAMMGTKLDFCVRAGCKTIFPLIQEQPYIDKVFVQHYWLKQGERQVATPALRSQYDKVFDLAYKQFPTLPLIDFIADQQGLKLVDPIPFLQVNGKANDTIAYGFSNFRLDLVDRFMMILKLLCRRFEFRDVTTMPWLEAASWIKNAKGFVGSRSSNYVLAHGVKQPNIFVYEPNTGRHSYIVTCPYHGEDFLSAGILDYLSTDPKAAAESAAEYIHGW